jgi:hypothetical protein
MDLNRTMDSFRIVGTVIGGVVMSGKSFHLRLERSPAVEMIDDKRDACILEPLLRSVEGECPMGVIRVELPEDLIGPIENEASELNIDASSFIAAVLHEKLRLLVKVGELEVFVPANIL